MRNSGGTVDDVDLLVRRLTGTLDTLAVIARRIHRHESPRET